MRVALVTVGDELLAGETLNTNAAWLGRQLHERGARVEYVVVVPDRVGDIAEAVNRARAAYDAVVVTGGLGPTHDDVTLEGVAAALGVPVAEHPDAVSWFEAHPGYSSEELVEGTTHLPRGARMLPNDEGVAPGAVLSGEDGVPVYVLPGVPDEMRTMFELVADEFSGRQRTLETVETGEPESALLDRLAGLRERFDGIAVGSYPSAEGVRLRLEGEDDEEVAAAAAWLRERVDALEPAGE